jgi:hypothetical protein
VDINAIRIIAMNHSLSGSCFVIWIFLRPLATTSDAPCYVGAHSRTGYLISRS